MLYVACYFLAVLQCIRAEGAPPGQQFTSNAHLESLMYFEERISYLLVDYVKMEFAKLTNDEVHTPRKLDLEKLEKLAQKHRKHNERLTRKVERILTNPIDGFLLIKRMREWVKEVTPILSKDPEHRYVKKISEFDGVMPTNADLNGAVYGINRLQDFYFLNFTDVANGNLMGVKSPKLSMEDCFVLGHISFASQDLYHAGMWFSIALEKSNTLKKMIQKQKEEANTETMMSSSELKEKTLDFLLQSCFHHGNTTNIRPLLDKMIIEIDPKSYKVFANKAYLQNMMNNSKPDVVRILGMATRDEFKKSDGYASYEEYIHAKYEEFLTYSALCRGEKKDQPKYGKTRVLLKAQRGLKCRLLHKNHPKHILEPLKEEIVSTDPWIVVYHDVFNEREVGEMYSVSLRLLDNYDETAEQTGKKPCKDQINPNIRIVETAWLYASTSSPKVTEMNKRIGEITGLSTSVYNSDPLQCANFGIGGHYIPHCDQRKCHPKRSDDKMTAGPRDRMATFMVYLTHVQEGGATVFPDVGISIKPVNGTAVFWYNLRKNGSSNPKAKHADCPVVLGNKWVLNKWMRERGQEFRRPCSTRPQD